MTTIRIRNCLRSLLCAFALFAVAIWGGAQAQAASIGAWTLSGPGVTSVSGANDSPTFTYALNPAGFDTVTWTASAEVLESGTYEFDWNYSGFHAFFNVTAFLNTTNPFSNLVDEGPENCCTSPSAGFDFSGNTSFAVTAGDTIGFTFGGSNFDSNNQLNGTLIIEAVPLPATGLMLLAGVGGMVAMRRRKKS